MNGNQGGGPGLLEGRISGLMGSLRAERVGKSWLHGFNGLFQLTTGRDIKKVLKCIREQKERWGGEGRNPRMGKKVSKQK